MTDYEESYKNYLAWLTPRELLQEYKFMRFPWRYRERKWIKEEIESRCVYQCWMQFCGLVLVLY